MDEGVSEDALFNIPPEILAAISVVQGASFDGNRAAAKAIDILPITTPIVLKKAAAKKLAQSKLRKEYRGQLIGDEGVFIGQWRMRDKAGQRIGKTFNVFAAPQDLTDKAGQRILLDFNAAVQHVAELKNWHGHDGGLYKTDKEIYEALEKNTYKGEWFIPPFDILGSYVEDRRAVRFASLYQNKEVGVLKGTFTYIWNGHNLSDYYWSSTPYHFNSDGVMIVSFAHGRDSWDKKSGSEVNCRVVRLVEVK